MELKFTIALASFLVLGLLDVKLVTSQYFDVNEEYYCERWENWAGCSKSCGGGVDSRRRGCRWKEVGEDENEFFTQTNTRNCNVDKCPYWGEWSGWSKCTVTCGSGSASRERACAADVKDKLKCKGLNVETRTCALGDCPYWDGWTAWSGCSKSCGGGIGARKRICHTGRGSVKGCDGKSTEERKCSDFFCPYWSDWSAWSACDASCGNGTILRTRTCVKDPRGEVSCSGPVKEEKACSLRECSFWSDWSEWTKCDVTCGDGNQSQARTCSFKDGTQGACNGPSIKMQACSLPVCPSWTNWSDWSECSARCGGGVRDRLRTCTGAQGTTFKCEGAAQEDQPCAMYPCPFWGDWTTWSECSGTCGPGVETKSRPCHSDPSSGLSCDGGAVSTRSCTHPECPFWHDWSDWTQCDATCNGGKKHKTRQCEELNGFHCDGPVTETVICAPYPCPVWSNWTGWSQCDATCDGGVMRKSRKCIMDPASGFRCDGMATDMQACGQVACQDCTPDLLNCNFQNGFCNFTVASRSPLSFYFRLNKKGFAETYAPFPKLGDWTELRSMVFKSCMAGPYCLTLKHASGGTGKELSNDIILLRSVDAGQEQVLWKRHNHPAHQVGTIALDLDLTVGQQVVFKVSQDTKAFEYFWIYDIITTRGRCR